MKKLISILILAFTITKASSQTYIFCKGATVIPAELRNGKIIYTGDPKSLSFKSLFIINDEKIFFKGEKGNGSDYIIDSIDKPTADGKHHYFYTRHEDGSRYIVDIRLNSNSVLVQSEDAQMIYIIDYHNALKN